MAEKKKAGCFLGGKALQSFNNPNPCLLGRKWNHILMVKESIAELRIYQRRDHKNEEDKNYIIVQHMSIDSGQSLIRQGHFCSYY